MKIFIKNSLLVLILGTSACGQQEALQNEVESDIKSHLTPSSSSSIQVGPQSSLKQEKWRAGDPIAELSLAKIQTLSREDIQSIPAESIPSLSISQIRAFSRNQLLFFTLEQIGLLTVDQFLARDPLDFQFFSADQYAALSVKVFESFRSQDFSFILPRFLKRLSSEQIQILTRAPQYLRDSVSGRVLQDFTREEIHAAEPYLYDFLLLIYSQSSGDFLSKLSIEQISNLPPHLISKIVILHLNSLSFEQMMAFTPAQIQYLEPRARDYANQRRAPAPDPNAGNPYENQNRNGEYPRAEAMASLGDRVKRDALVNFLRRTTENGYVCQLPAGRDFDFETLSRERRRALRKLHPDKRASTSIAQSLNLCWDEYIAENERFGR